VLLPLPEADVFTTRDAVSAGATSRQLEWAVRGGRLHRLRRGVLCRAETWTTADATGRAALLARAQVLAAPLTTGVVSHVTAAALLGLPVPDDTAGRVWVTLPPGSRPRRDGDLVRQVASLPLDEVSRVNGVPCTTAARTVSDCLRHLPAIEAVPLADAALRDGRVTSAELSAAVGRHRWPRAGAATELLGLLNGKRESVFESQSAVVMHQYGLPKPAEQARIADDRGRVVARSDFVWLEQGVVGEADGLLKYSGEDSARVVAAERAREARLRALGLVVVRWTVAMLYGDPPMMVQQLRAALANGDGRRFRGRVA
jgi:hypothetical protein